MATVIGRKDSNHDHRHHHNHDHRYDALRSWMCRSAAIL